MVDVYDLTASLGTQRVYFSLTFGTFGCSHVDLSQTDRLVGSSFVERQVDSAISMLIHEFL